MAIMTIVVIKQQENTCQKVPNQFGTNSVINTGVIKLYFLARQILPSTAFVDVIVTMENVVAMLELTKKTVLFS
jgi:hypothetical protein